MGDGAGVTGNVYIRNGGMLRLSGAGNQVLQLGTNGGVGRLHIGAGDGIGIPEDAGTLDADGVDLGSAGSYVSFNHTDNSGTFEFAPVISGVGSVRQRAGITTFTGIKTYTGATTVSGGALHIAAGGSIAGSAATVNGGGLVVDGLAGQVNVGNGGFLGGTGTVAAVTIGNGGTLAPGNSIGAITVNGLLTFAPGSTYEVEVSPTDADRTDVAAVGGAGTADLSGATVVPIYEPGSYVARQYAIVNADGGLGGTTFAGLSGTAPAGFVQSLDYDADTAWLVLSLAMSGPGPFGALDQNQQAVATALTDYFTANGGIPAAYAFTTPGELTQASGEAGTAAQQAGLAAAGQFLSTIGTPWLPGSGSTDGIPGNAAPAAYAGEDATDRIAHRFEAAFATQASAPVPARSAWGTVIGGGQWLAGNATVGSQDSATALAGLASGIDWQAGGTRAGLALGVTWANASLASGLGRASDGTFSIGARASHDFGGFYLSGAAAYGLHAVDTARTAFGETYRAAFTGHSFSGRAEAGARWRAGTAEIFPYAAFQAAAFANPAYAETGSGAGLFALNYAARTTTETRGELGVRLSHRSVDAASATEISGRLAWAHYFSTARTTSAGFAALAGTNFLTNGATGASDTALVSFAYRRDWGNKSVSLGLDGEFGAGTIVAGARAGLRIVW